MTDFIKQKLRVNLSMFKEKFANLKDLFRAKKRADQDPTTTHSHQSLSQYVSPKMRDPRSTLGNKTI